MASSNNLKNGNNSDNTNILNNANITKGTIMRQQKEQERKEQLQKNQSKQVANNFSKQVKDKYLGAYKRVVIDSFVGVFNENYGDSFDYNSLVNSLKFSLKEDKNGLTPDFSFKSNSIEFKGDAKKECIKFNENSKDNFISNDDLITGNLDIRQNFDDYKEFDAYQAGDVYYKDIDQLDGQFISTTNNERYGEFNRINKIKGYSPVEESEKSAKKITNDVWSKTKDKVLPVSMTNKKL